MVMLFAENTLIRFGFAYRQWCRSAPMCFCCAWFFAKQKSNSENCFRKRPRRTNWCWRIQFITQQIACSSRQRGSAASTITNFCFQLRFFSCWVEYVESVLETRRMYSNKLPFFIAIKIKALADNVICWHRRALRLAINELSSLSVSIWPDLKTQTNSNVLMGKHIIQRK